MFLAEPRVAALTTSATWPHSLTELLTAVLTLLYNAQHFFLSFSFATNLQAMSKLLRRPTRVECFYCQSQVDPRDPRSFRCPECHCWNRYDAHGEIISDEPAMHDENLNSKSFARRGMSAYIHLRVLTVQALYRLFSFHSMIEPPQGRTVYPLNTEHLFCSVIRAKPTRCYCRIFCQTTSLLQMCV